MKVGITTDAVAAISLEEVCQEVVLVTSEEMNASFFLNFIKKNVQHEIVIHSLLDLNMQLIQLSPALKLLHQQQKNLHLLKHDVLGQIGDVASTAALYQMAIMEETVMRSRTIGGIENARKNGIIAGRPKIDSQIVDKIKALYRSRQKTIREIASICGVSVGTAYKYATLEEKE